MWMCVEDREPVRNEEETRSRGWGAGARAAPADRVSGRLKFSPSSLPGAHHVCKVFFSKWRVLLPFCPLPLLPWCGGLSPSDGVSGTLVLKHLPWPAGMSSSLFNGPRLRGVTYTSEVADQEMVLTARLTLCPGKFPLRGDPPGMPYC